MGEFPIVPIIVSGVISVVFFGVGLFLVVRMLARRSGGGGGGLAGLAQRYPGPAEPEGQVFNHQSVQVGAVTWKRCVKVGIGQRGLFLHARSVFVSRPPVLIPWAEIKRCEQRSLFWRTAGQLTVGDPIVATVTVLDPVLEAIRSHLKPSVWT